MAIMKEPIIEWQARIENTSFSSIDNIYAGTHTENKAIVVYLRIWNNKGGIETVQDLTDFNIIMRFRNIEDTVLYEYCNVSHRNVLLDKKIEKKYAIVKMPEYIKISGNNNDGTEEASSNYLDLKFVFQAGLNVSLKENDMKELSFSIEKL